MGNFEIIQDMVCLPHSPSSMFAGDKLGFMFILKFSKVDVGVYFVCDDLFAQYQK